MKGKQGIKVDVGQAIIHLDCYALVFQAINDYFRTKLENIKNNPSLIERENEDVAAVLSIEMSYFGEPCLALGYS